ncbi:16228_t:CDS:1, partial [Racocetra persica]
NNKILVSRRLSNVEWYPNHMQTPGGKLELLKTFSGNEVWESPEVCALRELYEETGICGEIINKIDAFPPNNPGRFGTVHVYLVRIVSSPTPLHYEYEKNTHWIFQDIDSLKKENNISPALKKYLQKYWSDEK